MTSLQDSVVDLSPALRAYFAAWEAMNASCPHRIPRLNWACAEDPHGLPVHLALNAAGYVFAGEYLKRCGLRPDTVLDLGCGTGHDTRYFRETYVPFASVVGLDRNAAAVKFAQASYSSEGLAFVAGDACSMPFESRAFSLVIAVFSIIHTMSEEDRLACLVEAARVLRPGGVLIFTTPNRLVSQSIYNPTPGNSSELMFSSLLRVEYTRPELEALLSVVTAAGSPYSSFEIGGLVNEAFVPVWRETINTLAAQRFRSGWSGATLSWLARRLLPPHILTRYFFRILNQTRKNLGVEYNNIVESAEYHGPGNTTVPIHHVVIARKSVDEKGS